MSKDSSRSIADAQVQATYSRIMRPWGMVTALVILALSFVLIPTLVQIAMAFIPSLIGWSPTKTQDWLDNSSAATFLSMLLIYGLGLAFLFWFINRKKASIIETLGLGKPKWRDLWLAFLGFIAYVLLFFLTFAIVESVMHINTNVKQDIGFQQGVTGSNLAMAFIGLVILPPIAEEIFFRGFFYGTLRDRLAKWPTIVITSLLFAGLHIFTGSNGQLLWSAFFDILALSLVLCYLRERNGTIWSSVGVHALKNLLVFTYLFIIGVH